MAVPEPDEHRPVPKGGSDRGEVGALVLMTLAFAGWVAAAVNVGEDRMFFFGALAAVLTMAGLALMGSAATSEPVEG